MQVAVFLFQLVLFQGQDPMEDELDDDLRYPRISGQFLGQMSSPKGSLKPPICPSARRGKSSWGWRVASGSAAP